MGISHAMGLLLLGVPSGGGVRYSLRDTFTTPANAPLTGSRTCEPGPGLLTIVDTNNVTSIADGSLRWAGTGVVNNRLVTGLIDHAAGRAWSWRIPFRYVANSRLRHGIATAAANLNLYKASLRYTAPNAARLSRGGTNLYIHTLGVNEHQFTLINRPNGGQIVLARNGRSGDFTLLYVLGATTIAQALWQLGLFESATNESIGLDDLMCADLGGAWALDWGKATSHVAAPADGEVITALADGFTEVLWTAGAGETLEVRVRRTDDNNCWLVRCAQAGSTIKTIQVQASIETERDSDAQTWTAGTQYRVCVWAQGDLVKTFVSTSTADTAKNEYNSATFNKTVGGAKVSGSAAIADFAAWPGTLTLPTVLSDYTLPESTTLQRVSQQALWSSSGSHDWVGRPTLIETAAGEWMTAYWSSTGHNDDPGALIHLRFSDDEGVSWSNEDKTIADASVSGAPFIATDAAKYIIEPVLIRCPNDDLLLLSYERPGAGTHQWRSTDNGASWDHEGIINSDTTLVASDDWCIVGSSIYMVCRVDPGSDFAHPHYLACYVTADNGVAWTKAGDIETSLDCNESGIVHVSGDTLKVIVKDTSFYNTYVYTSTDLGVNWSARGYVTDKLHWMAKPRCKSLGGYKWVMGRDYRSTTRAVIYRSTDAVEWEPAFYPFPEGYEGSDNGYCDILQRSNGDFYMLSYAGATTAAGIIEAVFRLS